MMVGFMEAVGTSFQSAIAERNAHTTIKHVSIGFTHSRQRYMCHRFDGATLCLSSFVIRCALMSLEKATAAFRSNKIRLLWDMDSADLLQSNDIWKSVS